MYPPEYDAPRRPANSAGAPRGQQRRPAPASRPGQTAGGRESAYRRSSQGEAGYPSQRSMPPGGGQPSPSGGRQPRRRRKKNQALGVLLTCIVFAALAISGAAIFMTLQQKDGETVPGGDAVDALAPGGALSGLDLLPCYSEEMLAVNYLQVASGVTVHPMLAATHDQASTAYSTTPVALGTSGQENIAQWKTVNDDTIGWLRIPGTNIDYAVVQGPTTSYYTEKGYDKNYSKNGVIWAAGNCVIGDGRSASLSPNTVLYGHNWTNYGAYPKVTDPNDEMFAQLTSYHHLWFAKSHPYIWFSTESQEMLWQIFAVFYADTGFYYIDPAGGSPVLDGALARSEFIYDIPVSTSDKILTLSTCTQRFGPSREQRFVVMAKLVDGASSAQPSITTNPNPQRPSL